MLLGVQTRFELLVHKYTMMSIRVFKVTVYHGSKRIQRMVIYIFGYNFDLA